MELDVYCTRCGVTDEMARSYRGTPVIFWFLVGLTVLSLFISMALFAIVLIALIVYSLYGMINSPMCANCGSLEVIPPDSPATQRPFSLPRQDAP